MLYCTTDGDSVGDGVCRLHCDDLAGYGVGRYVDCLCFMVIRGPFLCFFAVSGELKVLPL